MIKPLTIPQLTGEKPQPPKPDWAGAMLAISPSTISTWQECPRKVAWDKIAKVKRAPSVSTDKGIAVHHVQENWLRLKIPQNLSLTVQLCDGGLFKPGPVAAQGMRHLPAHDHLLAVERRVWVRRNSDAWYLHGDTDFSFTNEDGLYAVGDHKTTGDFKWMKTVEELQTDPQAMIYGGAAIRERNELHPHAKYDPIEARWIYYHVGLKGSKRVSLLLTPDEVENGLQKLDLVADDICQTLNSLKVLTDTPVADRVKSLKPNLEACGNFGGCPYVGNCQIGAKERFKAQLNQYTLAESKAHPQAPITSQTKESSAMSETLAEKIARRNAEKAAQQGTAQTVSHAPNVPPVPVYTKTGPAEYTYSGKPAPVVAPPVPTNLPGVQVSFSQTPPVPEYDHVSVNPPPMPPRVAGAAPPALPQRSQAEREAADAEELKPRKPRAKKTHAEVATEIVVQEAMEAVEAVAHPTDYQLPESTKQKLEASWDFDLPKTLYVDCFPSKGGGLPITQYSELASCAAIRAAEVNNVTHYRFIQYGQATGALQLCLRTVLEEQPVVRSIFVDSRTQEAIDGMPELERWADIVIRRM